MYRDHLAVKQAFLSKGSPNFQDDMEKNASPTESWWAEIVLDPRPQIETGSRSQL